MTIKLRLFWTLSAYALAVLVLFGSGEYVFEKREVLEKQRSSHQEEMARLVSVCREANLAGSAVVALNFVKLAEREPAVDFAACLGADGRVQAHSDAGRIGEMQADRFHAAAFEGSGASGEASTDAGGRPTSEWSAPVRVKGKVVGVARLSYDVEALQDAVRRKLRRVFMNLSSIGFATFLLALLLSLTIASSLTRPILQLVRAARMIGSGRFSFRSRAARRRDELGHLAREINAMAGRLAELDELKKDFLDHITHDLRSPLTSVMGDARLLLKGEQDGRRRSRLERIQKASRRLARYIDDILELSRLEAGRTEPERAPIDLGRTVGAVLDLHKARAAELRVALEADVAPDLPKAFAEEVLVHRALDNLVSNALKLTPEEGRVRVSARRHDPGRLQIEVSDTGPGIPTDSLASVFEKFSQVKGKRGRTGTGIGLAVVKRIVEAHGGRVSVRNAEKRGAVFRFTLPVSSP